MGDHVNENDLNRDWGEEFPILREMVFMNHAGVAPISKRAAVAIARYASHANQFAYVDAGWYPTIQKFKQRAAKLIGARGEHEIAITGNTSAGLSIVAGGFDWKEGDEVVITDVEFPANRYPWLALQDLGVKVVEVPQQEDGRVEVEDVVEAITAATKVVAISHVQYGSGYCIDLKPIAEMVHMARGYLCVDAIQSVGVRPVDVQSLDIDFLAVDGHKWLLGPEGCGFFYCREDLAEMLQPRQVGWLSMVDALDYDNYRFEFWPDARRFEAGSYNVPGMLGLAASMELLLEVGIEVVWARVEQLTKYFCEQLESKGYRVFSPREDGERSGSVVFDPPAEVAKEHGGVEGIVRELADQGIVIATRRGHLRASPHFYNTMEQVDRLVASLPLKK